jgi:hypothetical protein
MELKSRLHKKSMLKMARLLKIPVWPVGVVLLLVLSAARAENQHSATRDSVPGVVIAHSPASSNIYVGSAGITILDDGSYLAKHDEFGKGSTEYVSAITRVYHSTDHGDSWTRIATIDGLFWASIFVHRGAVYMLGTHHHPGSLVVYRSNDGGSTWSTPADSKSGLIRPGRWHTAPVPVVVHNGRLWRAVEDGEGGESWGFMYRPRVMSIPAGGDLLDGGQWTISNPIQRNGGWLGGTFRWVLEGNIVVDPQGTIRNILRSDRDDLAAVTSISENGELQSIDPEFDRTSLPGSSKKVLIRWDEPSRAYWALTNPPLPSTVEEKGTGARNTLALFNSPDLKNWTMRCVLLHHQDREKHAFQYPDWVVDGEDLIVASRTAYDDGLGGAARAHDANYLTFHRFPGFRNLSMSNGVQLE